MSKYKYKTHEMYILGREDSNEPIRKEQIQPHGYIRTNNNQMNLNDRPRYKKRHTFLLLTQFNALFFRYC